jgi:hypothetical protein
MPKYYPTNRSVNIQTALAHIQNLCAKAGSHKMKKLKNTNNTTTVSTMQATESNGPTDSG